MGMNLQAGIHLIVNGEPWPQVSWKSATRVILKGGAALKAKLPKDQTSLRRGRESPGSRRALPFGIAGRRRTLGRLLVALPPFLFQNVTVTGLKLV